jgi:hypothetical protein
MVDHDFYGSNYAEWNYHGFTWNYYDFKMLVQNCEVRGLV